MKRHRLPNGCGQAMRKLELAVRLFDTYDPTRQLAGLDAFEDADKLAKIPEDVKQQVWDAAVGVAACRQLQITALTIHEFKVVKSCTPIRAIIARHTHHESSSSA